MRGDRSVCGSQCGRDGDRGEETVQPQRRRSFSLGTAAVSAGVPESELTRHLNEMNFLSAHRSSNPTTPATQSVSEMCRNDLRLIGVQSHSGRVQLTWPFKPISSL